MALRCSGMGSRPTTMATSIGSSKTVGASIAMTERAALTTAGTSRDCPTVRLIRSNTSGTTLWDVELSELGYIQHCAEGVPQCVGGFPCAFSPFLDDCSFAFCVGEDVWLINGTDETVAMTWPGVVRTHAYVNKLKTLRDYLAVQSSMIDTPEK